MKNCVNFIPERVTKNTVRFQEEVASDIGVITVGTLYVQKAALAQIGYKTGDIIKVTMEVVK